MPSEVFYKNPFSCEFWEISKNTYFKEHLHTAAT